LLQFAAMQGRSKREKRVLPQAPACICGRSAWFINWRSLKAAWKAQGVSIIWIVSEAQMPERKNLQTNDKSGGIVQKE